MTNTAMLEEKIAKSGYKLRYLAECVGLTYQGFLNKLRNKSEFKASEMKILCEMLSIDAVEKELIFFS